MLELIIAGGASAVSYIKSRDFTRDRLTHVDRAQSRTAAIVAGAVTTLAAAPLVALLPIVGGVTAVALGGGVGFGVYRGQSAIRKRIRSEY
ncbi:MAG TPA: hypothetical protein VML95_04395 [Longimicrobiales bacterium]|jgi:hypothetical protein|nr:hypothetical protein [Longimicrobiales bacterium]